MINERLFELLLIYILSTDLLKNIQNVNEVIISEFTRQQTFGIPAPDFFKWIFSNEELGIAIQISLKCVPKGPLDKKSALV